MLHRVWRKLQTHKLYRPVKNKNSIKILIKINRSPINNMSELKNN